MVGIEKHDFESLRGAEILLRAHFNKVLEECSESLSYMGKKEKETWQSLDLLQDDCEKMKLQVKEKVNQQVKLKLPCDRNVNMSLGVTKDSA